MPYETPSSTVNAKCISCVECGQSVQLIDSQSVDIWKVLQSQRPFFLSNGAYQEFTVGADVTLTLANWSSTTAKTGRVRVHVKSDLAAGASGNRTITFASNAGGGTIKTNTNWPTNDLTAVIGAPNLGESTKYYAFEFVSYDSGATVWAEYLGIYQ